MEVEDCERDNNKLNGNKATWSGTTEESELFLTNLNIRLGTKKNFPSPHNFRLGNFSHSLQRLFLPKDIIQLVSAMYTRYPYLYYAAQYSTLTDTKMKPEFVAFKVCCFLSPTLSPPLVDRSCVSQLFFRQPTWPERCVAVPNKHNGLISLE